MPKKIVNSEKNLTKKIVDKLKRLWYIRNATWENTNMFFEN